MPDSYGQTKRLVGLAILFVLFVYVGVISLQVYGGGPGSIYYDAYKILQLFVLSGDWAFQQNVNPIVKMQAYVAPVFTVIGIVEIFTAQLFLHIWQSVRLARISNHAVLSGLNDETIFLLASLNQADTKTEVVIIDANPLRDLEAKCRRAGAILIKGDPGTRHVLARARIHRARIAISFLDEATDSLQFVLSANAEIRQKTPRNAHSKKPEIDLWVRLKEASFGVRLGEYFKFAGMSESAAPRFFSIEEIAARRIIRAHPPEIYADAQGQTALHLSIYGHNALSTQVIVEMLRQSTSASEDRVNLTIFTSHPSTCEDEVRALIPEIDKMANLDVRQLTIHPSGISSRDYSLLPEQSTLHVVCYDRPEISVNVALSLRRLLLTRPDTSDDAKARRVNAPILVHLANTRGIGELLRSNVDRRAHDQHTGHLLEYENEIPDGIFAFGAVEDILTGDQDDFFIPTLIDSIRENIARNLHFSYVRDRSVSREQKPTDSAVTYRAEREWEKLPQEFRESSRLAADHLWSKATAMRFRIAKSGAEKNDLILSNEEHELLAKLEHHRWLNERYLGGWTYGPKRVDAARRHNLLRPWSAISDKEKTFDQSLAARLQGTLASVGLEIKRELVIGVVGHRPGQNRIIDEAHVRRSLKNEIRRHIAEFPNREPVIYTALAEGTDTFAAEIALELGIPYWVPLPMPYDSYSQDYDRAHSPEQGEGPAEKLRRLVALSDRYIELPLKFGDLMDVSISYGDTAYPLARDKQYAMAGAYIVERADVLIAVWDGNDSHGLGGTGDVVVWRQQGQVPEEFATPSVFRQRPPMSPPVVISPTPLLNET